MEIDALFINIQIVMYSTRMLVFAYDFKLRERTP